ncbi:MAG: NAD(P)H-hydrate dehydratase [Candidatus Aenigmatarchaeota archaeon]
MEVRLDILKEIYKKREEWCHKHDFGNLLVIGASKLYPTTPLLVALAAYRAGVDWVTIAAPEEASKIIASYSPDIMVYPLKGDFLSKENVEEILKISEKRDAIEIGGGLTRDEKVLEAIFEILKKIDKPCVIDDDAIYAFSKHKEELKGKNFVLTPHSYEFFVLSGIKVGNDLKERIEAVKKVAKELKVTILLKGHFDVISDGERVAVNKTGSTAMTKAGFGNTLAGILAAYLARKVDAFTAACAAAYVNGKAGELASKKFSEGILPTDLIQFIPEVIKKVRKY